MHKKTFYLLLCLLALCGQYAEAQKKSTPKYPSLFWEITGNGLTRPSYLFGTMHVSNKMVFHLSDSFYTALKSVDAVALELNPDTWQSKMVEMNKVKQDYSNFVQSPRGDLLTEKSFAIGPYADELKMAMSSEPTMVNSLLYRSYKAREDFEEDTFLDLYIYQTGKKLGKRATGVEDYFETEKIVLEAYADMAKEKKKKSLDLDGESMYNISEKTQEAYRRGDLDLLDSLSRMVDRSEAFTEKFLYKRNEIQANSMDTIMRKSSLFVGVGAAHLPGKRGVIELLRAKGYQLRPIFMNDRDALQKDTVDHLKVPVVLTTRTAEDGFYSVDMPGPLFNLSEDSRSLDRRQYSDMSNGSYYVVSRIKTYAGFIGQDETEVLKKVDSVLYENIPGKILSKKAITRNGYAGYDISNRTRSGNLQRYNIFVTPLEILMFKMSGKESYVQGPEAEQFFSSIRMKEPNNSLQEFTPARGGFAIGFPQTPASFFNDNTADGIDRWEYYAGDKTTGDAYLVFKKSVYNFRIVDEDSFDLGLIESSFRSSEYFDKQQSRQFGSLNGYPYLDVKEKMKDGSIISARYLIKGPDYYVIAARSKNKKKDFSSFLQSFHFTKENYGPTNLYTDTSFRFTVNTPVFPVLDEDYRGRAEKTASDMAAGSSGNTEFWPKIKTALFKNDSTGERIAVNIQEYPKYYFPRDNKPFWKDELLESAKRADLVLRKSDSSRLAGGGMRYDFIFSDTGSSRTIRRMVQLDGRYLYSLVTMGDTLSAPSAFVSSFFNSFTPIRAKAGEGIYDNKLPAFFADIFSKDSTTRAKARQSISNVYYGEQGVPGIINAINQLSFTDKDYFGIKSKLIAELGYIKDTVKPVVVQHLKKIYEQTADTSFFQNEVLMALARHKTQPAYDLLKTLLLQDPPVFDNNYTYSLLFNYLDDSLALARSFYPELMQLSTLDDYKDRVTGMLVKLVDSNMITAKDYDTYYAKIYFDAKIELKKQRSKDEKLMEKERKKDDDNNGNNYQRYGSSYANSKTDLDNYSVLLLPFYDQHNTVPKYFERLLQSNDPMVRMNASVLLLKGGKKVADNILLQLASDDKYSSRLYSRLEKINRTDAFPAKYKSQVALSRSYLVNSRNYDKIDSIALISKQKATYRNKKGTVYFFKYRVKKEDDWKIGISGLQPENEKEISSDDKLVLMTDKKIKEDEPLHEQLQLQLKKLLFNFHKSGRNFYNSNDYARVMRTID